MYLILKPVILKRRKDKYIFIREAIKPIIIHKYY